MPQDYPHFHLFHLMTFDLILTSLGHTPTEWGPGWDHALCVYSIEFLVSAIYFSRDVKYFKCLVGF